MGFTGSGDASDIDKCAGAAGQESGQAGAYFSVLCLSAAGEYFSLLVDLSVFFSLFGLVSEDPSKCGPGWFFKCGLGGLWTSPASRIRWVVGWWAGSLWYPCWTMRYSGPGRFFPGRLLGFDGISPEWTVPERDGSIRRGWVIGGALLNRLSVIGLSVGLVLFGIRVVRGLCLAVPGSPCHLVVAP